jgi:membrane fusion protein (multidrug efflux system)
VLRFFPRVATGAFSRTLRSLAAEHAQRWRIATWLILGASLLTAWTAWLFLARVTVWETSAHARLEVDRAVHPVATALAGRVVSSRLQLGRAVQAGEVLVELDAESERRRLDEERARLAALQPQVDALRREIAAEDQSSKREREVTQSALGAANARRTEAESVSGLADEVSRRLAKLREKDGVAELELVRAKAQEQEKRAAAQALASDAQRIEQQQRMRDSQTRARLEELRRTAAELAGRIATTRASIDTLAEEVEKHLVRAPTAGKLGEVANLQNGAVLQAGERIGTVVPAGDLRIVAEFDPAVSLGRVRSGQSARVRLDGFPWLQYGSLSARVDSVATEPRDGTVRVELAVVASDPRIPLQHGLPGIVEVEVERVTPAVLVLRAAGAPMDKPR